MADNPTWRQGYDALEQQVGPRLEQLLQSDAFAIAAGLVARAQRTVEAESGRMTRRLLHRLNLPAGSDVTRILNEIGQLRRQVHELTVELDDARAELARAQADAPQAAGRTRATAKRATKKAASTKAAAERASTKGAARASAGA